MESKSFLWRCTSTTGTMDILKRFLCQLVLLGTPLALAILEFAHPAHVAHDITTSFFPVARWWFTLHIIQFILFSLMGGAIYLLTDDIDGIAMAASRLGAAVFVVFYNLGEAVIGVATGLLGRGAGAFTPAVQQARADAIQTIFHDPTINAIYDIGRTGWFVAMLSASVAVYRRRRARLPATCFALSGLILWYFDHPAPYGSLAFGLFFVAALRLQMAEKDGFLSQRRR